MSGIRLETLVAVNVITAVGAVILGAYAKDTNVTGGTKLNTEAAPTTPLGMK
jgi:hypothetical protein